MAVHRGVVESLLTGQRLEDPSEVAHYPMFRFRAGVDFRLAVVALEQYLTRPPRCVCTFVVDAATIFYFRSVSFIMYCGGCYATWRGESTSDITGHSLLSSWRQNFGRLCICTRYFCFLLTALCVSLF